MVGYRINTKKFNDNIEKKKHCGLATHIDGLLGHSKVIGDFVRRDAGVTRSWDSSSAANFFPQPPYVLWCGIIQVFVMEPQ
jgi:hypothetical protein